MIYYYLDCDATTLRCYIDRKLVVNDRLIVNICILAISFFGIISNLIWYWTDHFFSVYISLFRIKSYFLLSSVYVFMRTPNLRSRFFNSLKIYSMNSLLVNFHNLVIVIVQISLNQSVWFYKSVDLFENSTYIFCFTYILLPIWSIVYTFAGKYLLHSLNLTCLLF